MWDVGLIDLFAGDDIVVVEWADRIPGLFPDDYLEITIDYVDGDQRRPVQGQGLVMWNCSEIGVLCQPGAIVLGQSIAVMLFAIDTSTKHAGIALYDGARGVIAEYNWHSANRHTEELMPAVARCWRRPV